jgi:SAM-dependent methyltransferase
MEKSQYEHKKKRELEWYDRKHQKSRTGVISTILNSPAIKNFKRFGYNYAFPKNQMKGLIKRHVKSNKLAKILIAPCGTGDDYQYLKQFSNNIYGIDLSPIAVNSCPTEIKVKTGDILDSQYPDNFFDLIASPLFFHHLVKIGFAPFLQEFYRILRPGGKLIILDFSLYYPLNIITRPIIKRLFKNPYGEVEDEDPIRPKQMLKSLENIGYANLEVVGATFSHPIFFIPVAKIINRFTKYLLNKTPFKYYAWMILFWAEKRK